MTLAAPEPDLARDLRARGQRVTSQRLVVLDALRRLDRHVTAEQVHAAVLERLPGVALPTIYATLELFGELGLVRRLSVEPGAALYDPRREAHEHAVCVRCGRVEDLDVDLDLERAERAAGGQGFSAVEAEVVVRGVCAACEAGG